LRVAIDRRVVWWRETNTKGNLVKFLELSLTHPSSPEIHWDMLRFYF